MNGKPKVIILDFSNVLYIPEEGLNQDLLKWIASNLQPQFRLKILTASSQLPNSPLANQLLPIFEEIITTAEFGWEKHDPQAFTALADQFGVVPSQLFLIDDSPANIDAIRQAGGDGLVFSSNAQLTETLPKRLGL